MSLRDKRQEEFADKWLVNKFGILYLCPRFGKIKTAINCLKTFTKPRVLIVYPLETIKTSWEEDLKKWEYSDADITYCTTASLHKLGENPKLFDVIIFDEIHMFSPNNLLDARKLIEHGNKTVLGLSGTISDNTKSEIYEAINMPILAHYPIEQAIEEGVVTDYEINVILTELDNSNKYIQPSKTKKFFITEYQRYDWLSKKIDECKELGKDYGLLPIQRMNLFKKSVAKLNTTKKLLRMFKDERVLVFCGVTEIADKLGIPVYHSKNKDKKIKEDFCNGKGDALATVDMFEAGVTIKPINRAIINSFDSNPENLAQRISRLTNFEFDSPNKRAVVYIVCTNTVELKWLKKALEFFDLSKVKYKRIEEL